MYIITYNLNKNISNCLRQPSHRALEGRTTASRERSWGVLGASWERLGTSWEAKPSWSRLGAVLKPSWKRLGSVLGTSWAVLEASWGRLVGLFEVSWAVLWASLGISGSWRHVVRDFPTKKWLHVRLASKMPFFIGFLPKFASNFDTRKPTKR